ELPDSPSLSCFSLGPAASPWGSRCGRECTRPSRPGPTPGCGAQVGKPGGEYVSRKPRRGREAISLAARIDRLVQTGQLARRGSLHGLAGLTLGEAIVASGRADGPEKPHPGPASHGGWRDPEEPGNLGTAQKCLVRMTFRLTSCHPTATPSAPCAP